MQLSVPTRNHNRLHVYDITCPLHCRCCGGHKIAHEIVHEIAFNSDFRRLLSHRKSDTESIVFTDDLLAHEIAHEIACLNRPYSGWRSYTDDRIVQAGIGSQTVTDRPIRFVSESVGRKACRRNEVY
jgi:hypothetical protein